MILLLATETYVAAKNVKTKLFITLIKLNVKIVLLINVLLFQINLTELNVYAKIVNRITL